MSFEYELRRSHGTLDRQDHTQLKGVLDALGGKRVDQSESTVIPSGRPLGEITVFVQNNGLLLVVNTIQVLQTAQFRALVEQGRALGLRLYEVEDDEPIEL